MTLNDLCNAGVFVDRTICMQASFRQDTEGWYGAVQTAMSVSQSINRSLYLSVINKVMNKSVACDRTHKALTVALMKY